ncbi:MAG: DNA translocase FtsK [Spirochaetaceae bacterium]|nr:DNA translocase FtsK [Spirochaetaceae bacterium]
MRIIPSFLLLPGMVLYGAYGYSSVLIPLFLITAGALLIIPGWSVKWGIYLGGFVFPFFTIVASEVMWHTIPRSGSVFLDAVKTITLVLATALVIAIEYVLLGIAGDMLSNRKRGVLSGFVQTGVMNIKKILPAGKLKNTESVSPVSASPKEPEPPVFVPEVLTAETEPVIYPETDSITEDERAWLFEENYMDTREEDNSAFGRWYRGLAEDSAAESSAEDDTVKEPPTDEERVFSAVKELDSEEVAYLMEEQRPLSEELPESENGDILTGTELPHEGVASASGQEENTPIFLDLHWKDSADDSFEFEAPTDVYTAEPEGDQGEDSTKLFDEPQMFEEPELIDEDFYSEEEEQFLADPFSENEQSPEAGGCGESTQVTRVPRKKKHYSVPVEGILSSYPDGEYWIIDDATQDAAVVLKETLQEFNIQAEVIGIRKGPVITMFEILPAPGVRLNKIVALQDNISLRLAASSVRIVAPIPGKHAVGIEIPNRERAIVSFRELIETDIPAFRKMEVPVILGKDITGEAKMLDLTTTPHLLIAGATGSGKSVCVNSIILSILYKRSPEEVKMILIDPKIVELKLYNDIPHLLTPVITEPKRAFQALQYCLCEMERRYAMLDRMGVRDIKSYNRRITERNLAMEKIPYIVVIIDEFADLMSTTGKELESTVARLAAMSRAVGVHLVLATQRPSIDVITGLIKANIPSRIAFMVASKMDSRIIIDQVGSEKLLGKGDMLYASAVDPFPVRIQGTFVSEEEVENVVDYVKQYGEPEYIDEEMFFDDDEDAALDASLFTEGDDPLYDKALEIVLQAGKASASYIQRRLKIGYNRAARLVEEMEDRGIVGPANGSKPRDVVHVPAV